MFCNTKQLQYYLGDVIMKDMVQFGLKIKQLREHNALSLRELGERSGVSYSFINSIEHNRFNPSRETVIALADALKLSDKDELLLLAGFAPVEEESLTSSAMESILDLDDPEMSMFFKDFKNAPKERRDEMLRFWNFIKDQHVSRDPSSKQGE
ncbi:Helix-turn-helix domain protein [compost metagenome]